MPPPLVNVAVDYPPPAGSDDWQPSYQQAVDDIRATGQPAVIYTPGRAKPYRVSGPILCDVDDVVFRGDGASSVLQGSTNSNVLQFGVKRDPLGVPLDPKHWVSTTGLLDDPAGGRWAPRTCNDAVVSFAASPFNFGPPDDAFWAGPRQLTLDFAVQNNGPWNSWVNFFGLMDKALPSPFYCYSSGSRTALTFQTDDGATRTAWLPFTPGAGVVRVSIQADLVAGTVTGWVDRQYVAVDLSSIGACWGSGLALVPNQNAPFNIGGLSSKAWGYNDLNGIPEDVTFLGLKLSNAPLYRTLGCKQVRIDGTPLDDGWQFLRVESSTIALLALSDVVNGYRGVPWAGGCGGDFRGSGLFLNYYVPLPDGKANNGSGDNANTISGNAVRDMKVLAGPYYGQAVSLGYVYEFTLSDCWFWNGGHNVGALNFGASYPIMIHNCELMYGRDAAYYGVTQTIFGSELTIKYYGRTAVRLKACVAHFSNVFCTNSDICDCVLKCHDWGNGGRYVLDNWMVDFEAGGPRTAYFWCEAHTYVPGTLLAVRDSTLGAFGPDTLLACLPSPENPSTAYSPCRFTTSNLQINLAACSKVRAGSLWSVKVDCLMWPFAGG